MGGSSPGSMQRAGRYFDGWFPITPKAEQYRDMWTEVRNFATEAGRDASAITGAMYMTLRVDDDVAAAEARIGEFLEAYYPGRGEQMMRSQALYAGGAAGAVDYLSAYADAGVSHFVIRFTGDHEEQLETLTAIRGELGW